MPRVIVWFGALLACLTIGCGGSDTGSGGAAVEVPTTPGKVSFRSEPGTPVEEAKALEEMWADVRAYFADEADHDLHRDVEVVITGRGATIEHPAYASYDPRIGVIEVTFYLGHESWPKGTTTDEQINKNIVVAHEYFHVLQFDLASYGKDPGFSPDWLAEGSADLASLRYADDRGFVDLPATIRRVQTLVTEYRVPRLGKFEGTDEHYFQSLLAVNGLAEKTSFGTVIDFFGDLGSVRWEDAFKRNFGVTEEAYLKEYEARRP